MDERALCVFARRLAAAIHRHKNGLPTEAQLIFVSVSLALLDVVGEMQDDQMAKLDAVEASAA